MKIQVLLFFLLLSPLLAAAENHSIYRDIPYMPVNSEAFDPERHVLDVYTPRVKNISTEVVVFIHGGKWKTANKDMFNYIGINFAEKGKTAVLINYRLTPNVDYEGMAMDCANAVKWVRTQIGYYGGDTSKIYVYGHSSGGHLAALIATNDRFFDSLAIRNPIKGCVLIDGFGMNMYNYLLKPNSGDEWMYETFGKEQYQWKDASPAFFVTNNSPKFLMFLGEKTINIIYHDARNFKELLESKQIEAELVVIDHRRHMEMIAQLMDYRNDIYDKCIEFMKSD
ncbi:MAG TPA: alpha/beta hydrolase [Cytophagaceae bacterium]|nr:alpha/beta hydrolase [Cytophagaceae bacterium]